MINSNILNISDIYMALPENCLTISVASLSFQILFCHYVYRPRMEDYQSVEQIMNSRLFYDYFTTSQKNIKLMCNNDVTALAHIRDPYLHTLIPELTHAHSKFSVWFSVRDYGSNYRTLSDLVIDNLGDLTSGTLQETVVELNNALTCLV